MKLFLGLLVFAGMLPLLFAAYPSCNNFGFKNYSLNTSQSGICYWSGGYLYINWSHGIGSGYTYSVDSYQNPNVSVAVSGGGTFTNKDRCSGLVGPTYYPKSDYRVTMTTAGTNVNYSCPSAYIRFIVYPYSTSTTRTTTVQHTNSSTTSTQGTSVTTTLNITVSPTTPLLIVSSDQVYTNQTVTITSNTVYPSDAVEIILDGNVLVLGLKTIKYQTSFSMPGAHYVQAYDITTHEYSHELLIEVLPPTTTSTTSIFTTMSTSVNSYSTTSLTTTVKSNQTQGQPGFFQQLWDAIVNFFSHL